MWWFFGFAVELQCLSMHIIFIHRSNERPSTQFTCLPDTFIMLKKVLVNSRSHVSLSYLQYHVSLENIVDASITLIQHKSLNMRICQ